MFGSLLVGAAVMGFVVWRPHTKDPIHSQGANTSRSQGTNSSPAEPIEETTPTLIADGSPPPPDTPDITEASGSPSSTPEDAALGPGPERTRRIRQTLMREFALDPNEPSSGLIADHVVAITGADPAYDATSTVERLREHAGDVAHSLSQSLGELRAEGKWSYRTLATKILRDMDMHEALDALAAVALEPLPEVDPGSPVLSEASSTRDAAIGAISRLALRGNDNARSVLEELLGSVEQSTRQTAAMHYVNSGLDRRKLQARAIELLPEDEAHFAHMTMVTREDFEEGRIPDPEAPRAARMDR